MVEYRPGGPVPGAWGMDAVTWLVFWTQWWESLEPEERTRIATEARN